MQQEGSDTICLILTQQEGSDTICLILTQQEGSDTICLILMQQCNIGLLISYLVTTVFTSTINRCGN